MQKYLAPQKYKIHCLSSSQKSPGMQRSKKNVNHNKEKNQPKDYTLQKITLVNLKQSKRDTI